MIFEVVYGCTYCMSHISSIEFLIDLRLLLQPAKFDLAQQIFLSWTFLNDVHKIVTKTMEF